MGHSHSSPTIPTRISDLPWQDGHYKCNMYWIADTILIKGNTVHMLHFGTLEMTAGVFGKKTDNLNDH